MKQFRQLFPILILLAVSRHFLFSQAPSIKIQKEYSYGTKKKDDILHDVIECVDGCMLAIGETEGASGGTERDALLMKLDRQGKVVFMERMGTDEDDVGSAVAELPMGQILVGGITRLCSGRKGKEDACPTTAWLRCRSAEGDRLWQKDLAKHSSDLSIGDVLVDRMHNQVVVSGSLNGFLWVYITDFSGEKIIEKTFDRDLQEIKKLKIRAVHSQLFNGAYYLYGGGERNDGSQFQNPFVIKLDEFANVQEIVSFPDYPLTETGQISVLADGWLGLTGAVQGDYSTDCFFLRVDTTLDKSTSRFEQVKTRGDEESGAEIVQLEGQCYLFGHFTRGKIGAKSDFFVARFTPDGKALDEDKDLFKYGNKFEEKALRLLFKTDHSLWLCGTQNNGGEVSKDFNFWFARLEVPSQPALLVPQAVLSLPPVLKLENLTSNKIITLLPDGSNYMRIAIQNPNNQPFRGLTLTTTAENPPPGLVWSREINAPEIAAQANLPIDISFHAGEKSPGGDCQMTTVVKDASGREVGRLQYIVEVKAPEKPLIVVTAYEWLPQTPDKLPVKGVPLTLRMNLKNMGTASAEGFTLYWHAPQAVPFSGSDQQVLPVLPPGATAMMEATLLPPASFPGNRLELKAFVNSPKAEGFEFAFPVELLAGDFSKTAEASTTQPEIPVSDTKLSSGITLVVAWSTQDDKEQTTIQQVYEINAIGISNKPLKVESFKVILNGDTIPYPGAKMDEVTLKNARSENHYKNYFTYPVSLKPGRNILQVMVSNEQRIEFTEERVVNYKPYDKGTLYVYSIGIPDPKGQLKYTEKDARDFAGLVKNHPLYGEVITNVITGRDSTQADEITLALSILQKDNRRRVLNEKDGVMVFISGHGFLDPEGNLRLKCSNYDVDAEDKTSLDFQKDLLAKLEPLDCKKLLLVDACQSIPASDPKGRKSGEENVYSDALDKLFRASKSARSMLSCSPGEYSYEDTAWENGAFTYVLKSVLANPRLCKDLDKNMDRGLSLQELLPYLQAEVPALVQKAKGGKALQTPSMPEWQMGDDVPFFAY